MAATGTDSRGQARRQRGSPYRAAAAFLVSGGLVAWLLSRIDLADAMSRLAAADPRWMALAALFSLAVLLLRSLRFRSLVVGAGYPLTTAAVAIQVFLNRVTPFRLGEISLPLLLRRHAGEDTASSLVGVVFVRLVDLAIVAGAVAVSFAWATDAPGGGWMAAALALLLAALLASFRWWLGACARLLRDVATRWGWTRSAKVEGAIGKLVAATAEGRRLDQGGLLVVTLSSLGIFLAQTAMFGCILVAFGVHLPLPALARGGAVAQAGAAIPVAAVGTIGTQEASWVAGYAWVGVPLEVAIVTGIAAQLLTLAFAAAFAGPAWLWLSRRRPLGVPPPAATERAKA